MKKAVKFATQLEEKILKDLKSYAKEHDQKISTIVSNAVAEYLAKYRVRPAFQVAMDEVIHEHADLLEKLAK